MVAEAARGAPPGRHRHAGDLASSTRFPRAPRGAPSAFLTVQEGCDKFCTYCVVPYTRGAEISRPWGDIVAEAHALVDAGAREIVLLGQNVNAWADGERGLADLIRALGQDRWPRAHPLHHQPPGRHERRADRRPRRGRQADALSPPAGAVGQQPHPQGDEPQPHAPKPISRHSRRSAPRAPTSPCPATSSSASRARPKRISKRRCSIVDEVALRRRLIRSNMRRARARRPRPWRTRFPREVMEDGCSG